MSGKKPIDLKRIRKYVNEWFDSRPSDEAKAEIEETLSGKYLPQSRAVRLRSEFGYRACQEGIRHLLEDEAEQGWTCLANGWRCHASAIKIYFDRFDQLAESLPEKAQRRELPIGMVSGAELSDILLHVMFAIAFRQDRFATFCGERLIKNFHEIDYLTNGRSDWNAGPLSPAFLKLTAIWLRIDLDLTRRAKVSLGPYSQLFDAWNDDKRFGEELLEICEFHSEDGRKRGDHFGTAPYYIIPAEIWALKRIRTELGLFFPEQIDHPLMQTPFSVIPATVNFHEPCPEIARMIEVCSKQMTVSVPWEKN